MVKTASPLHAKPIPKRVSKPTATAEAAATVAESAVEAPARRAAAKKAKAAVPAQAAKPVKATKAAKPAAEPKPAKAHKPKLVRDSFTMPKDEYQAIDTLKGRALALGKHVRKSELLRAGIQALSALNDRAFLKALDAVPTLKTGRPKAD